MREGEREAIHIGYTYDRLGDDWDDWSIVLRYIFDSLERELQSCVYEDYTGEGGVGEPVRNKMFVSGMLMFGILRTWLLGCGGGYVAQCWDNDTSSNDGIGWVCLFMMLSLSKYMVEDR